MPDLSTTIASILQVLEFIIKFQWAKWIWRRFLDACCNRPIMQKHLQKHYAEKMEKKHKAEIAELERNMNIKQGSIDVREESLQGMERLKDIAIEERDAIKRQKDEAEEKYKKLIDALPAITSHMTDQIGKVFDSFSEKAFDLLDKKDQELDRYIYLLRVLYIASGMGIDFNEKHISALYYTIMYKMEYSEIIKGLEMQKTRAPEHLRAMLPGVSSVDIKALPEKKKE